MARDLGVSRTDSQLRTLRAPDPPVRRKSGWCWIPCARYHCRLSIDSRSDPRAPRTLVASPFRAKGGLFINTRTFFEKNADKGFESLREVLGAGPLRDFVDQHFLSGSWYEVMHVPQLIAAEASAMRMTERRYLRHRTEWQAAADMGGAYRILLRVASPEVVVPRLPKVMTQMFNFADPTVSMLGPKEYRMSVDGVPAALGTWLHTALEIYVEYAITASGGQNAFVAMERPRVLESREGFPMLALSMRVTWE